MHCQPEPESWPHRLLLSQYLPSVIVSNAAQVFAACAGWAGTTMAAVVNSAVSRVFQRFIGRIPSVLATSD
jgi:hypothetical protein